MHPQIVEEKLKILPDNAGCYIMKNANDQIIYVGKAKVLKNRVRSYFIGAHSGKVQKMIEEITDFEYIITKNEAEALILENQLIKAHKPRYNILLKDDKSYPYIALTKEDHPRLILTRTPHKKYDKIFGPYTSAYEARETLEILNYLYPFRKCVIMPKKECLYYHIKQCLAPCILDIDPVVYKSYISDVTTFLRGNHQKIKKTLNDRMEMAAMNLEFEQAAIYRNMLQTIETIFDKKGTHQNITEDTDVIGYAYNQDFIAIQIFHIRGGSVVERESDVFINNSSDIFDTLENYIYQFYQSNSVLLPKKIYLTKELWSESLQSVFEYTEFFTPIRGTKKELLQFAMQNAEEALEQKALLATNEYNNTIGAIERLGELLNIAPPHVMEIIDTANLRNQDIVSAVAVFINGYPSKKDYRKFNIKSTTTQDDYQALREVVYRRFYRKIMEQTTMPDLLIVDGGIGHVHVALEVLESLNVNINLIGLKKNDRHRTEAIILPDGTEIKLKTTDPLYKLLGKMQEEVHHFVIDFHRKKRIQSAFSSDLLEIKGIGEATRKKLLKHYVHIDNIKKASIEELSQILTAKQAENVYNYYNAQITEEH